MGKYIGVKEVAEYLGLSRGTIYYYIAKKKIPFYRFNGKPRFVIDEIDTHIAKKKEGAR